MPATPADPAQQPPARPGPPGRPKLPSWAAEPRGSRAGGWSRRTRLRALIALGVVLFLAISILLARFLQTENVERDADLALIQAQARGDVQGMLDNLSGCRSNSGCVAAVKANAANPRLVRKGSVKILQLVSPTSYAMFGATGRTRLAWTVLGTLPVVQCVTVRRTGNFLTGVKVTLTGLSAPIPNEADC
jgi:hypothetical protein